jgi:hypothetical protein
MPGKKFPECHSSLCPSEKELLAHSITKIPLLGNVPATKKGIQLSTVTEELISRALFLVNK